MKRFLKGFLSIALLLAGVASIQAVCGPAGCGSTIPGKSAPGCGTCGIVGTNTCNDDSTCADSCNDRCCDGYYFGQSHFSPRSQGVDGARRLAGVYGTHIADKDEVYFNLDVALAYQRTFDGEKIGKFFSPICDNCFWIGADSQTNINVRNQDFGYNGTAQVCLCPQVQNFISDFNLFIGFNEWLEGLYAEVQLPVVYTKWSTNCCPRNQTIGSEEDMATWDDEYMFSTTGDDEVKIFNAVTALQGGVPWAQAPKMCYARLCCDKQTKVRIGDLRFRLGYDFWLKDSYHFGLKAILAAPTGNKAKAVFAFEPIAGNGGHWELGGGLNTSALLWEKDEDKTVRWFLDVELTHLFNAKQRRTFDLSTNGVWSRYLLLKQFTNNGDALDERHPLERGPNVLTQETRVRANIQADITTFFRIKYNNWLFDIGYNAWARSTEKLEVCVNIPAKTYGIKGILDLHTNATETASEATISTAKDKDGVPLTDGDKTEFINNDGSDLNVCSATHPFTHSHAVFGHVAYIWEDMDWEPVLGLGGKGEFSGRGNTAFNQWEIWLKGNISF